MSTENVLRDFTALADAKDVEIERLCEELANANTEAGRLRSELNMEVVARRKTEDELADWQGAVQQRNAEIERLRTAARYAHTAIKTYHAMYPHRATGALLDASGGLWEALAWGANNA
jgi:chromosome segregation ATPase